MGCNKNLTNDQPQVMITATDEEMWQTEQPMTCLTERTKHKCQRCTRFFSNQAALKQHHCEPQIKNCPHCNKIVNHTNNLQKHLRSCEKAPTHPSKQKLRQMTMDGPTSLVNGPSTPKKLMVEEVQVGGAPAKHAEIWKAPELVESALKYFRKAFNSNKRQPAAIERGYP